MAVTRYGRLHKNGRLTDISRRPPPELEGTEVVEVTELDRSGITEPGPWFFRRSDKQASKGIRKRERAKPGSA